MAALNSVLITLLYFLGIAALVVLIIVGIKLINMLDKANMVIDDVNSKVKSLDGFFDAINYATSTVTTFGNKIMNKVTSLFDRFKKRKDIEEDFYE